MHCHPLRYDPKEAPAATDLPVLVQKKQPAQWPGPYCAVQVPVKYGLVHRFPAATPRHKSGTPDYRRCIWYPGRSAARLRVSLNRLRPFPISTNYLGYMSRESGHSRVPLPPQRITGQSFSITYTRRSFPLSGGEQLRMRQKRLQFGVQHYGGFFAQSVIDELRLFIAVYDEHIGQPHEFKAFTRRSRHLPS